MCIYYQSPIFIAIFARIFLKEKLPKLTPIICILSIIGIIFISQPTFLINIYDKLFNGDTSDIESLSITGIISEFIAAISWAATAVLVRTAPNTHFIQLEIISSGITILIAIPLLMTLSEFILHNKTIGTWNIINEWSFNGIDIMITIIIGIVGFTAVSMGTIGFQYGEATKLAWLEYTSIIFAFLFQTYLFNDIPNDFEIIGAVLIGIAICLSIAEEIYHNYKKNKDKQGYEQIPVKDNFV